MRYSDASFALLYYEMLDSFVECLTILVSTMYFNVYWFCEVYAENTHNGFGINDVSSADDINIKWHLACGINELFNIIDRGQLHRKSFHLVFIPLYDILEYAYYYIRLLEKNNCYFSRGKEKMRILFCTLGCKANQADTGAMSAYLTSRGHTTSEEGEPCDAIVINTCTVTAVSDAKSRKTIRHYRREYPNALLCVCGCLPAVADVGEVADIDLIGSSKDRIAFAAAVEALHEKKIQPPLESAQPDFEILPASTTDGRTRAYLKIQDGCENFCSYCIIPKARGKCRSLPIADAVRLAKDAFSNGSHELVLTGIEISSYNFGLVTLLQALSTEIPELRIRLGSLEPTVFTEETVLEMQKCKNLCPHFHISLQSGSDSVLRRMNRKYDTACYAKAVQLLRNAFNNPAITTDLICGFPAETEAEHSETLAFVEKIGFSSMHIFPYSRRPETPAANMQGHLTKAEKQARCAEVGTLEEKMKKAYLETQLGTVLQVLVENNESDCSVGHSENYVSVRVNGIFPQGSVVAAKIIGLEGDTLVGVACSE